ncbi:MAG: FMN-binding protein [Actinobacteria bacterium]|nr:FMN-binding protein [Actinomycetota bacterium]
MTRNKSADDQFPLARRLTPAVLLASGGVVFLAMVDGPENTIILNSSSTTGSVSSSSSSTSNPTGSTSTQELTCGAARSTGAQVEFKWGIVQVEALLDGEGELCEVEVLQFPDADRRSLAINNFALPILREAVVVAKNANVQAVSGATLTSRAYMASLQFALDNS